MKPKVLMRFRRYRVEASREHYDIIDMIDDHWRNGFFEHVAYVRGPDELAYVSEFLTLADTLAVVGPDRGDDGDGV